jgi:hypothetical protein
MASDPYTLFNTNINNHSNNTNNSNEYYIKQCLKNCKYKSFDSSCSVKECPISLEEFKEGDSIIELPCNHIFNENNIKKWLKETPNCPVCRHDIIQKENNTLQYHRITEQIDNLINFMSSRMRNSDSIEHETLEEIFELF